MADDESQLDIKLKWITGNISLKIMSVLTSGLWRHFLTKSRFLQVKEVENIFNTDICSRRKKIKQNRKRTWERDNGWRPPLVNHLWRSSIRSAILLCTLVVPRPCITARSFDPACFNALAPYALGRKEAESSSPLHSICGLRINVWLEAFI